MGSSIRRTIMPACSSSNMVDSSAQAKRSTHRSHQRVTSACGRGVVWIGYFAPHHELDWKNPMWNAWLTFLSRPLRLLTCRRQFAHGEECRGRTTIARRLLHRTRRAELPQAHHANRTMGSQCQCGSAHQFAASISPKERDGRYKFGEGWIPVPLPPPPGPLQLSQVPSDRHAEASKKSTSTPP